MTMLGNGIINEKEDGIISDYIKDSYTYFAENDILIAKITPCMEHGKCAIAKNLKNGIAFGSTEYNIFRVKDNRILTEYLFMFLNRDIIRKQAENNMVGTSGRQRVPIMFYKNLQIPILNIEFQQRIKNIVNNSHMKLNQSRLLYSQAEKLLLEELDLKEWQVSKENVAIKSFKSSFLDTGRLDAEYYQPKYDNIITKIKAHKNDYCTLEEALEYIYTGEYSEMYYKKNKGLKFYIRSTNIKKGQIEVDPDYYVKAEKFNKMVKVGDILSTRVGSIGTFGEVRKELDGSICSDNVLCFRMSRNFDPSVYTMLFNTSFIFELVDRLSRGSVQQRLNQETLKTLVIPILDERFQQKIADEIQKSFIFKEQSEHLLVIAKCAVEIALERNEEIASKYINEELERINITINN